MAAIVRSNTQVVSPSIFFIHNVLFYSLADKLEPYYDDAQDPIMDTDELDSEEEIIMIGGAAGSKATRDYDYRD